MHYLHDARSIDPLVGVLLFLIFPIVFTSFGWKYVIIPWIWPIVRNGFKVLMVVVWIGFAVAVASTPLFYRAFGINVIDAICAMTGKDMAHRLRWERENSATPEGRWEPNWRKHRKLAPLEPSWDGPAPARVTPWAIPLWSFVAMVLLLMLKRDQARKSDRATLPARQRVVSAVQSMPRMTHVVYPPTPRLPRPPRLAPPTAPAADDSELVGALRGLGFSMRAIRQVKDQVQGATLEDKIRDALQRLTRR